MARKIDRSRIDAGKIELPKKLAYLTTEKVDYLSVTDRDGDFTVELSAAALFKLVKTRVELKALKAEQKSAVKTRADAMNAEREAQDTALAAEKEAHRETQAALAKAERKVKSLTKAATSAAVPAAAPVASGTEPTKPAVTTPSKRTKAMKPAKTVAQGMPPEGLDAAVTADAEPLAGQEPHDTSTGK